MKGNYFTRIKIFFRNFIESFLPEVDGLEVEALERLHVKNPLSNFILPQSFDPDLGFFFCADNTVGLMYELPPLTAAGEKTVQALRDGIYKADLPEDTLIQFILWGSEYIEPFLQSYVSMRPEEKRWFVERYADFYRKHIWNGPFPEWLCPLRNFRLFFVLKLPYSLNQYQKKKEELYHLRERIFSTLKAAGFTPYRVKARQLIQIYYLIFNPNHDKNRSESLHYDPAQEIRKQCIMGDTVIEQDDDYIRVDGVYGKALTVQAYPKEIDIGRARNLVGNIMGNDAEQINTPFFLVLCARRATETEKRRIYAKEAATPKAKKISSFSKKHEERVDELLYATNRLTEDGVFWKCSLIWYLYHPDYQFLTRAVNTLTHFAQGSHFTLQEEIANLPLFLACTPFNLTHPLLDGDVRATPGKKLARKKRTLSFGRATSYLVHNCTHLSPVQGDWSGTPTPTLPFVGRMGQVASISLWDTNASKNTVIVAPSGLGKSFLANHIATHYWSLNSLVRIVDVGYSYEPICRLFNGQFVEIDPANPITMNPFSEVKDLDVSMSFLVSIVSKMMKPKDPVSDRERGIIERAIRMTFEKYGKETNITKIRDTLLEMHESEHDKLLRQIAVDHLAPWVEGGQYGRLVNGKNQVDFHNPFVVVELSKCETHETLKSVVLLMVFYHLSREIYHGSEHFKKIIIWDEAWRYLHDEVAVEQIEKAAREYRKFNAALIIIMQSISDLARNESTKVIEENSDFLFILPQKSGVVKEMEKTQKFGLYPFEYKLINTLTTQKGRYSEFFAITCKNGNWVLRFLVPEDIYWIYTTDPDDKVLRSIFMEAGWPIEKIMDKCVQIKKTPGLRDFWQEVATAKKTEGKEVDLNQLLKYEEEILRKKAHG